MTTILVEDQEPTTVTVTDNGITVEVVQDDVSVELTGDAIDVSVTNETTEIELIDLSTTATLVDSRESVTIDVSGNIAVVGALPGEDLTLSYTDGLLTLVTGETFTKTLTYDSEDRLQTVVNSGTGETFTLAYNADGTLATRTVSP